MLTLATRIKLVVFALLAVVVIGYIAQGYADLGHYVGLRNYYTVKADLAQTGGLFPGSAVTYRGIQVGRVKTLKLTSDGVIAEMQIKHSAPKIPNNLKALVANRSAVGEEYIDLQPSVDARPYLADGAVIQRSQTATPAPVTDTLKSVNDLAASVPLGSLRTVVDELGQAFAGQGPNLQVLLDQSGKFIQTADDNIVPTIDLINDGNVVLRTQNDEADALKSFASNSALLARRLRDSDTDLRHLITAAPGAAGQLSGLLRDLDPSISVLLANLTTTSRLAQPRTPGLREFLAKLPALAAVGKTVVSTGELNMGLVNTFFNPLPCVTGYGGTTPRDGHSVGKSWPVNTGAKCALPASSGVDVRGAAHAPHFSIPSPSHPGSVGTGPANSLLPGALGLPALPPGPQDMQGLLGIGMNR